MVFYKHISFIFILLVLTTYFGLSVFILNLFKDFNPLKDYGRFSPFWTLENFVLSGFYPWLLITVCGCHYLYMASKAGCWRYTFRGKVGAFERLILIYKLILFCKLVSSWYIYYMYCVLGLDVRLLTK